ncbi:MAG: FAD-dependent oxidoreductase [Rubrivivax sp.]|nr:FAD-dependent oxidoreductase [Rubrivivax sp.]
MRQPRDIAVIGGGLAGLTAAWLLGRDHRVTLYERHARPGFTAHSASVLHAGQTVRVDVPLRVFYPGYYPSLLALYRDLGVATEPVSYATTFADRDGETFFRYRNLRWGAQSLAYVMPQDLRGPRARAMLAGAWRFRRAVQAAQAHGGLQGLSLAQFVEQGRHERAFVEGLLLPVVATICTCPHEAALRFPMTVVADYLLRGVTRQAVQRAVNGADEACQRLLQRVAVLRCGADVRALQRDAQGVTLLHGDGPPTRHDHVLLAAPAHRALQLIGQPEAAEREALGAVSHHAVTVVLHRDEGLMPRRRRDWSPVNAGVWPGQAQATIWVNAVQPALRDAPPLFQTVAPAAMPRDERVIALAHFERPVVDERSLDTPARLAQLHTQPGRRLWFCGSYAQAGIPLLEAAVGSAMAAVAALQRAESLAPWRAAEAA